MTAMRTTMSTSRKLFMAPSLPTGNGVEPGRMRAFSECAQSGLGAGGVILRAGTADAHPADDPAARRDRHAAAEDDEPTTAVGVQAEQLTARGREDGELCGRDAVGDRR